MNQNKLILMLKARTKAGHVVDITVRGISMLPVLREGDVVAVKKQADYKIGDILVYPYKDEGLLIHRLLDMSNSRLYCKGDNSFRLEDIDTEDVIGKVVLLNGTPLQANSLKTNMLCGYSLYINRLFVRKRYQIDAVKESILYKIYHQLFLKL